MTLEPVGGAGRGETVAAALIETQQAKLRLPVRCFLS
jgi:hypothetical protein